MADIKTKPTALSVDAYLEAVDDPQRKMDCRELVATLGRVSGEKPAMWGPAIVGFGTHTYLYADGREGTMPRIGFSSRKSALTLYVGSSLDANAELLAQLGPHKTGKGCLYIKRLADVDRAVLEKLLKKALRSAN